MLKINYRESLIHDKVLDITKMEPSTEGIKVTCNNAHNLIVGDEVIFKKSYYKDDVKYTYATLTKNVLKVIDNKTFIIENVGSKSLGIVSENPPLNKNRILVFDEYHNITPDDIKEYLKVYNSISLSIVNTTKTDGLITNIANVGEYSQLYFTTDTYDTSLLRMNQIYCTLPEENYIIVGKVEFPFNEFFFINKSNEYVLFKDITVNGRKPYYDIKVPFTTDVDYARLMQEDNIGIFYEKNVRDNIVPDIINMEKVKYKPILKSGNFAEALVFNLHFRKRINKVNSNGDIIEWYVEENSKDYWNTIDNPTEINSSNKEVSKSDLLGYLGFTANDILNQKMKLKKSFLRLSFYDSKDPISQKLMFYSTIFLDTGSLYGKYLKGVKKSKEKASLRRESTYSIMTDSDNENERLSSQFVVYDEYNTTRSSEGYNLYLFEDDALEKNVETDIYLKVEFNHAGYGRTIPFVMWNMDNPENGLTMDNLFDCLYFKVKIMYTDKGYVYTIPNAINDGNNRMIINLFEPRLEMEKK